MSLALDAARRAVHEALIALQGATKEADQARARSVEAEKRKHAKEREYEDARAELARMTGGATA